MVRMSASQLDTFHSCPAKWGYQYLDGLPTPQHASARAGTRTHEVLESWLSKGIPPNRDEVLVIGNKVYEIGKIAESGLHHLPPPGPHHDVEGGFTVPFLTRYPAVWRGFIDSSYQREEHEQHGMGPVVYTLPDGSQVLGRAVFIPEVLDHKTTSNLGYRKLPDDLLYDVQALVYAHVAFTRNPTAPRVNLRWVYYKTSKPYKSEVSFQTVTKEHVIRELSKWEDLAIVGPLRAKALGMRGDQMPKDVSACGAYGGCPFKNKPCRMTAQQQMEASMSTSEDLMAKIEATKQALSSGHVQAAPPPPVQGGLVPLLGAMPMQQPLHPFGAPSPFPAPQNGFGAPPPVAQPSFWDPHTLPPQQPTQSWPQLQPTPNGFELNTHAVPPQSQTVPPHSQTFQVVAAPQPPQPPQAPPVRTLPAPWQVHQDPAWVWNGDVAAPQFLPNTEETWARLSPPAPPAPPAPPQAPPSPPAQNHYPSSTETWPKEIREAIIGAIRANHSNAEIAERWSWVAPMLTQLRADLRTIDEVNMRVAVPATPPPPIDPQLKAMVLYALKQGATDAQILGVYTAARPYLDELRLEVFGPQRATGINAPESAGLPELAQPTPDANTPAPGKAPKEGGDAYDAMDAKALRDLAKQHNIDVKGLREVNLRSTVRNEMRAKGMAPAAQAPAQQLSEQAKLSWDPATNTTHTALQGPDVKMWDPPPLEPVLSGVEQIRKLLDAHNKIGDILRKLIGAD